MTRPFLTADEALCADAWDMLDECLCRADGDAAWLDVAERLDKALTAYLRAKWRRDDAVRWAPSGEPVPAYPDPGLDATRGVVGFDDDLTEGTG